MECYLFPIWDMRCLPFAFNAFHFISRIGFVVCNMERTEKISVKQHPFVLNGCGLLCCLISFLRWGHFTLAYMMATKTLHQQWYFGSVYFYHFQYNGWFLFRYSGLLLLQYWAMWLPIHKRSWHTGCITYKIYEKIVPPGFLSMLWMRVPTGWRSLQ